MCVETGLQGNDDLIKVMKLVKCRGQSLSLESSLQGLRKTPLSVSPEATEEGHPPLSIPELAF